MTLAISEANRDIWSAPLQAFSYRNADALFPAEAAILGSPGIALADARLLDLGIGTGRTTGHVAGRCLAYTGLDYSPAMVAAARRRFPGSDIRQMDARDLSAFASESFDLALFSFNGLDYVEQEDRLAILSEVRRVLRRGGRFVFSSHNRAAPVPGPLALTNLQLSANPARLAAGIAKYVAGIANAARMRRHERHEAEYALLNDNACQYRLLTYYITPAAQSAQLLRAGFADIQAFGLDGETIALADGKSGAGAADFMIHYLARRR